MSETKIKKLLDNLHTELATKLLETVRNPESKASDLNVARQFLKDKEVTSLPIDD